MYTGCNFPKFKELFDPKYNVPVWSLKHKSQQTNILDHNN